MCIMLHAGAPAPGSTAGGVYCKSISSRDEKCKRWAAESGAKWHGFLCTEQHLEATASNPPCVFRHRRALRRATNYGGGAGGGGRTVTVSSNDSMPVLGQAAGAGGGGMAVVPGAGTPAAAGYLAGAPDYGVPAYGAPAYGAGAGVAESPAGLSEVPAGVVGTGGLPAGGGAPGAVPAGAVPAGGDASALPPQVATVLSSAERAKNLPLVRRWLPGGTGRCRHL